MADNHCKASVSLISTPSCLAHSMISFNSIEALDDGMSPIVGFSFELFNWRIDDLSFEYCCLAQGTEADELTMNLGLFTA